MLYVFFDKAFLNPFGLLLRFGTAGQAVHFRSETQEFDGRGGTGFTFHLAEESVILFRVQRVSGLEIIGVEQVRRFLHVFVQILCLNFATHRIRVGKQSEEAAMFVAFDLQIIAVKLVHS